MSSTQNEQTLFKFGQIGSHWSKIRYVWVGMTLGQNSATPQFIGESIERLKAQKLFIFKLFDRISKIVKYIQDLVPFVN